MDPGPQCALLPDGRRLHLNHGPIDLIVGAFGPQSEIDAAYEQAATLFSHILNGLVGELKRLRQPVRSPRWVPKGPVAQRMMAACWPHRGEFVTPMAAVAGAVADEILAALIKGRNLERAYVNNGGDIAFHLSPGASLTAGLVVTEKYKRVARFHAETVEAALELIGAAGLSSPSELRPWHITRRVSQLETRHYGEIIEQIEPGSLLRDPLPKTFERAWRGSSAKSFIHPSESIAAQPTGSEALSA